MTTKQKKNGFNQKDLDRMVEQATKLGIGFAIVSKEALEGIIKRKTKDSKFSEKEAKQAVTNLVDESKRQEKKIVEKVKAIIKSAKANSPVISRADIVKMNAEIEKLKQQLKKKKK